MLTPENVNLLLKTTLCLITFSLGFSVSKNDFAEVFQHPKALTLGLILQMLALPFVAILLVMLFPLNLTYKIGIILIAICPGGTTSNLLSYLFRANVALSISLTAINGLLCLVSIPLLIELSFYIFGVGLKEFSFSVWQIVLDLLVIVIVPGALGVLLNTKYPLIAAKVQVYLKWLLPIGLFIVFGIKFFGAPENGGVLLERADFFYLLPPLILLNLSGTLVSFFIATWQGLRFHNRLTIAIEVGLQNTGLALFLAAKTYDMNMQKPALIYASFSFFTTLIIVGIINYKNSKKKTLQGIP